MAYAIVAIRLRFFTAEKEWLSPLDRVFRPASLVYETRDLRRIWEWEIAAGHYATIREGLVSISVVCYNSSIIFLVPAYVNLAVHDSAHPANPNGGTPRVYTSPKVLSTNVTYPPRPVPGSAADLDVIMDHCDFSTGKVGTIITPLSF